MRNRRIKKTLQEHPQLLDNSIVLSSSEVEKIIASSEYILSFEELIARAKMCFPQFGSGCWKEIDIAIQTQKKTAESARKQFRLNYRKALASIALIIILFFTCIPAGRTLAQAVYNYIVNVFDSSMTIEPEDSQHEATELSPQSTTSPKITYSSIEQFSEQTGYAPVQFNVDWLRIDKIWGEYTSGYGQFVSTTYVDKNGNIVCVDQEWFQGNGYSVETEADEFNTLILDNGYTLYTSISPIDSTWDGIMVLDDSILTIAAEAGINYDKLVDELSHIR